MWQTMTLWVVIGLFAVSIPLTILQIDKPREPMSRGTAAFIVAIDVLVLAGLLLGK